MTEPLAPGVTPDVALGGLPTSLTEGVDLGALSRWPLPEEEGRQAHDAADLLLSSGAGRHVDSMLTHTAAGTPDEVRAALKGTGDLMIAPAVSIAHVMLRSWVAAFDRENGV